MDSNDRAAVLGTPVSLGGRVDGWGASAEPPDEQIADRLTGLLGRPTGPVNWLELPADGAAEQWSRLRAWVCWLRTTFAYDHRVVPPCWYLHPALVEVLSALRDHWLSAYDSLNSPAAASEWHRVLAQLEPRLREWAARTGCNAREHRVDLVQPLSEDRERWERHVDGDVRRRSQAVLNIR